MARRRFALARARTVRVAKIAGRKGATLAVREAREGRHTLAAVVAAGGLGYLEKQGTQLPHVQKIGIPATYGLGFYILGRVTKNEYIKHAATGLLSVAVHDYFKSGDTTSGVDDMSGEVDEG